MLNLPKLIGHRGVKNLFPENTINSIEQAYKLGLSWVEVDVKISKDLILEELSQLIDCGKPPSPGDFQ